MDIDIYPMLIQHYRLLFKEPILHNSQNIFTEMSLGKGLVNWHSSSWEQNPTQSHIINILKTLPILEYEDACDDERGN